MGATSSVTKVLVEGTRPRDDYHLRTAQVFRASVELIGFEKEFKLINTEVGEILVEYSKHIARWAKKGDTSVENATPVTTRAHENAWRLLSFLITFAEHAKESDMYWKLLAIAQERKKTKREQDRLLAVAKNEDRGYMAAKVRLEATLAEMLQAERDNPRALGEEQLAGLAKPGKSAEHARKSLRKDAAGGAAASGGKSRKAPQAKTLVAPKKLSLTPVKKETLVKKPPVPKKTATKSPAVAKNPKA